MNSFSNIDSLMTEIQSRESKPFEEDECYKNILEENEELLQFLRYLEISNPCGQVYALYKRVLIISYQITWDFIALGKKHAISGRYRIIGLPISLSNAGYLIASEDDETRNNIKVIIKEFADNQRGTTIVLNSDVSISNGKYAPSTFVFYNTFKSFQDYLCSLRSSYRRKINAVLAKSNELSYRKIEQGSFSQSHYDLYLSVCERASRVFRILPFSYFRDCNADIFEVKDQKGKLLAFFQTKDIQKVLYFVYVGFRKDDKTTDKLQTLSHIDLYYALLLFIIQFGIEKGFKKIAFGQTSAESKCKVGCVEELKHIYVTSSNPFMKMIFKLFTELYSYKPYGVDHNVFHKS